jgi:hypothetical protein
MKSRRLSYRLLFSIDLRHPDNSIVDEMDRKYATSSKPNVAAVLLRSDKLHTDRLSPSQPKSGPLLLQPHRVRK